MFSLRRRLTRTLVVVGLVGIVLLGSIAATSRRPAHSVVNIVMWQQWGGGHEKRTLDKYFALFNKTHPGIHVSEIAVRDNTKIVAVSGGRPPDLLALLLNQRRRGVALYRALIYLPAIMPPVVTAIIWVWILNPENGLLNQVLSLVHLPQPGWLTDPTWSKPALLIMATWTLGQTMVILLAGLQDVPVQLHEAAMIDGAGCVRRFWHITLPMLSPVLFYNVVVGVIFSLQYFTQAFVAVGGGNNLGAPLNSTLFYSIYLYANAFGYFKMGYASAMAWLLFALTVIATALLFRFSRRLVYYEGTEGR